MPSSRHRESRHRYKGFPPRSWISVQARTVGGTLRRFNLLADTGSPIEVIIGPDDMESVAYKSAADLNSNFGPLQGGWLHLIIPELGFSAKTPGFSSAAVVAAVRASSPDFDGLAGLPLLRLFEFGGNADWFWLRSGNRSRRKS